jgi:hypothetical protein
MAEVMMPALTVFTSCPPAAIVSGIEPDNPPCHTTNPEYAEAFKSL